MAEKLTLFFIFVNLTDEGDLFVEDRAPDTELHLEHTTDSAGCDKSESEEATDTEDSSGIEELVDSSVCHQGGEEQSDVQSGSDTIVGEGEREVGESKRGRIKRKVKRQQFAKRGKEKEEEEEEEVEEEGLSRCRISRRRSLLQRRSLQRKMKLSGSRKQNIDRYITWNISILN